MGFFSNSAAKKTGSSFFTSSDQFNPESVQRSVDNAKLRIQDAGYKVEDADQRNWFEKLTNLPQKQNWFFDTLELLGRGGQAIMNPIDKALRGEEQNVGSSFFKGLSGKEKVRGSQIAEDLGIENKLLKTVVGTGLEVGLDPTTYIPGGVLLKGARYGLKGATAPLKGAYKLAEMASPTLKRFRTDVVEPTLATAKDKFGYAFKDDHRIEDTLSGGKSDKLAKYYNDAENKRRYLQDEYLNKTIDTAKTTGLDKGNLVGRQMESGLRQFKDVKGYEFPDGVTRTGNKSDLVNAVNVNKGHIKQLGKDINQSKREYQETIGDFSKAIDATDKDIKKLYFGIERDVKKSLSQADRGNLREARKGLTKINSQLDNFGQNETSMLKHFKKEVRDEYETRFDLLKKIRQTAPNGIKFINKSEIPNRLKNLSKEDGLHVDKVAQELGFDHADDMLENIRALDRLPRKLDSGSLESMARKEMERTGASKHLDLTKRELELGKQTLQASVKGLTSLKDAKKDVLTLYHGSDHTFDTFKPNKAQAGEGVFLTDSLEASKGYGKNQYKVEVQPKKIATDKEYNEAFDELEAEHKAKMQHIEDQFENNQIGRKEYEAQLNKLEKEWILGESANLEMNAKVSGRLKEKGYDLYHGDMQSGDKGKEYLVLDDKIIKSTFIGAEKLLSPRLTKATVAKQSFSDLSLNPHYQDLDTQRKALKAQLEGLKNDAKLSKQDKIAQIKKLESEVDKLKTSIQNPVMIQKELERPLREKITDPVILNAAKTLMEGNAELRELAKSEGISIGEIEWYMAHILSQEEKKRRKVNPILIDKGNFGLGQPNKSILKQRELMGSAEDVNERLNKKKFEDNAYFATAQGQRRLIDYIQSVSFRKNVLNDPDFARPYVKGAEVPPNAVVIDTNNYKFIKESGDLMEGIASKDIGGQYVVTKAAKQKLDKYKYSMTDEGSKAFLNAFDGIQSFWKRAALFSVPYHLRNDIGAKFNNWVGGMNAVDMVKYSKQADVEVFNAMIKGKESKMYNEYRQQGLGATSQSQVEFARRGADPDKAIEKMVKEGSKDLKGKVIDRLNPLRAFQTSQEFGTFVDQTNRYSAYVWAREKLKLSPEDAAKKVKEMQFDYTKLSNFERDFMTRGMPFYRWMRNNIPYQIKQFANDPRKYANLNKLRLNAQDAAGIDEENIPDWMKESFSIPVSSDGKGSGKMIGFNLPLGDLTKLSKPLKTLIDSATPVAKLPLELGINRNLFFNKPIEKFKGQAKQFNVLGQEFNVAIKTAYALEQATGQIGRGLSGFFTKPEEADQDTKFRMPSFGISSVLKDFDANKASYFQLQDKLKELQDYINYIQQQEGVRPREVSEIKKSNFMSK